MSALFAHLEVHAVRESGANLRRYQQPCFHQSYINSTCAGGARAQHIGCLRASGPSRAAAPSRPGPVLCALIGTSQPKKTYMNNWWGSARNLWFRTSCGLCFCIEHAFCKRIKQHHSCGSWKILFTRQTRKRLNLNNIFVILILFIVIFTSTWTNLRNRYLNNIVCEFGGNWVHCFFFKLLSKVIWDPQKQHFCCRFHIRKH